jgi:chemotaxis response regulator CheB
LLISPGANKQVEQYTHIISACRERKCRNETAAKDKRSGESLPVSFAFNSMYCEDVVITESSDLMPNTPQIGLICDHSSAVLEGRINHAGYRALRRSPDQLTRGAEAEVAAWVVDCEDSDSVADAVLWLGPRILAISNRPEPADLLPYRDWCERIILVLDKWTADLRDSDNAQTPSDASAFKDVQGVWLLAGSTGAIGAVRRFLGALDRVPPVAFLYAQHIHPTQQTTLTAIGRGNRALPCYLAVGRHWLNPGHVLIAPATSRLCFGRYGEVYSSREPWDTPETPNLDELMLAMSGMQPAPAGAMVFSGAGRDGCTGLSALSELGIEVWAQDPATCEAPSMPSAAITAGLPLLIGSPEGLAAALLSRYPASEE